MKLRGGKSTSALLTACSAVAIFAASDSAMAAPPNCPTQKGTGPGFIPVQTIKIFNDSFAQQIYAELEVGKPNPDLWIQDIRIQMHRKTSFIRTRQQ